MFSLPVLPYGYDALEPTVSANTLRFHHDKHHATYVNTLNQLLQESGQHPADLEQVVRDSADGEKKKLFNNAAQAWNHGFFWECMTPDRQTPDGDIARVIDAAFGGLPALREAFVKAGVEQFGSGWVWLVAQGDRLSVRATHDAGNPLAEGGGTPLLVCDLWEHAYYLDYQNDRKGFLGAWFDTVANWRFAQAQLTARRAGQGGWRYPAPQRAAQSA